MISLASPVNDVAERGQKIVKPVGSLFDWAVDNLNGLLIGGLVAAGIVGLMLLMRWVGARIIERHPEPNSWRGIIGHVLARTTVLFMVAAAIDIVTSYAPVPARLGRLTDIFFTIAAAFQAAIWAREIILGAIRSRVGEDPGESTLGNAMAIIRVLVNVTLFAIALIVILDNLGVNVTTLVAGLGIGGIAIGLAAQGIFADLFAALSIVFDRPFRRGDTVRFGTTTGTVERIGLKTTRVRALSGEQVIISNTKLLEQEVTNIAESTVRRVTITFGLVYRTPPATLDDLPRLVETVTKPQKNIRLIRCLVTGFGASAIDCELVYDHRSNDGDTIAHAKSAILIGVATLFAEQGIEFAYPTQTTFTAAPDGTLVMPYAGAPASLPKA